MTENTQIFIEFNVEKFFIKNVSKTPIPCSNKNYIFARFIFSQEWDNVEKTAVFTKDDIVCHIPIVDNKCAIPNELMLKAGTIEVSVFGGDRITTGNTILKVVESGFHDESEPPVPLDPTSVWVKSPDGSVSLVREVDGVFQYFDGDEWKNIISGGEGGTGYSGWTPVLSLVEYNEQYVLKVINWTGGSGVKPESGLYIGQEGLVADINDAVNIRGPVGPAGPAGAVGPAGPVGPAGEGFNPEVIQASVSEAVQAHNTSTSAHEDIRGSISGLETRINNISTGGGVISGDTPYTNYISGLSLTKEANASFKIKAGTCWDDTFTKPLTLPNDMIKTSNAWVGGTNQGANINSQADVPLIPAMSSMTAPSGTVTFSGTGYDYTTDAYRIFGGNVYNWQYITNVNGPSITYTFPSTYLGGGDFKINLQKVATVKPVTALSVTVALYNTDTSAWVNVHTFDTLDNAIYEKIINVSFNFNAIKFSFNGTTNGAAKWQRFQITRVAMKDKELVYAIGKETGTADIMFSHDMVPALPVGYIYKRKIGEIKFVEDVINTISPKSDLQELYFNTDFDIVLESKCSTDGVNWYRKYKSGWIEQGGNINTTTNANQTYNLAVPFTNPNYYTQVSNKNSSNAAKRICPNTTTTFIASAMDSQGNIIENLPLIWEAKGY